MNDNIELGEGDIHQPRKIIHCRPQESLFFYNLMNFETTMYFIGRVTLFFANNYLTEYQITMEF